MTKKIFLISGILFLILGGAFLAFKFILNSQNGKIEINLEENKNISNNSETGKASIASLEEKEKNEKIKKVIDGKIVSAVFNNKDNELIYYYNRNFLKTGGEDLISRVSILTYPFVEPSQIIWSQNYQKALVKDEGKYLLADFENNQTAPIDTAMDVAIFNRYYDKLIYKIFDKEKSITLIKQLNLADSTVEDICQLEEKRVDFKLNPISNKVLVYSSPNALEESKLFLVNMADKEKKEIFKGMAGVNYLWSPMGDKILVSYVNDSDKSKNILGLMNSQGGEFQGMDFPGLADKCAWSNDNTHIYCAGLTNIPETAIMPNDWLEKKVFNADVFWKINTENGKKERIVELSDIKEEYDGSNFFLDKEEKKLFFINRKDDSLYMIGL